jgi:hypothetical protein
MHATSVHIARLLSSKTRKACRTYNEHDTVIAVQYFWELAEDCQAVLWRQRLLKEQEYRDGCHDSYHCLTDCSWTMVCRVVSLL